MKLRYMIPAVIFTVAAPMAAEAACRHLGSSYSVGSTRCWSGWLERCTVAGYWKAIGQCKKNSAPKSAGSDVKGKPAVDPMKKDPKKTK